MIEGIRRWFLLFLVSLLTVTSVSSCNASHFKSKAAQVSQLVFASPSVRKLDERRVEFTVPEPFAPFLRYAGGITILPKHILQDSINTTDANGNLKFLSTWGTDTDPQQIIGNGLYKMVSYTPAQRLIFQE